MNCHWSLGSWLTCWPRSLMVPHSRLFAMRKQRMDSGCGVYQARRRKGYVKQNPFRGSGAFRLTQICITSNDIWAKWTHHCKYRCFVCVCVETNREIHKAVDSCACIHTPTHKPRCSGASFDVLFRLLTARPVVIRIHATLIGRMLAKQHSQRSLLARVRCKTPLRRLRRG